MMKTGLLFGALMAGAVLFTSPARADDASEIKALFKQLTTAMMAGKYDDTLKMETKDFKAVGPDGSSMTGQQMVATMKARDGMMKLKSMDIKVQKLDIKGTSAVAESAFSTKSEMTDAAGQMGPKGKTHTMEMSGQAKNQLEKTKAGWKFKTFEQKVMKMTMDGKPFDPTKMGGAPPPPKKH